MPFAQRNIDGIANASDGSGLESSARDGTAGLPLVVAAPARHPAGFEAGAAVAVSAGDLSDLRQTVHGNRCVVFFTGAFQAQLPITVGAPTPHGAVLADRAAVIVAADQRDTITNALDLDGLDAAATLSIAKLAFCIATPALHLAGALQGTNMVAPRRDLFDWAESVDGHRGGEHPLRVIADLSVPGVAPTLDLAVAGERAAVILAQRDLLDALEAANARHIQRHGTRAAATPVSELAVFVVAPTHHAAVGSECAAEVSPDFDLLCPGQAANFG